MLYQALIHTPTQTAAFAPYPSYDTKTLELANEEELQQVAALCEDSHNMAGFFKATVMPIRTDSWEALARDFFYPTLLNFYLSSAFSESLEKTSMVSAVSFIILAILYDALTSPIRLVMLLPRVIYNQYVTPREHPLQVFLRDRGILIQKEGPQEVTVSLLQVKKEGEHVEWCKGKNYRLVLWDRQVAFLPSCSEERMGGDNRAVTNTTPLAVEEFIRNSQRA